MIPSASPPGLGVALLAEQVRLHRRAAGSSSQAALLMGLLIAVLLWDGPHRGRVVVWLLPLLAVVSLRMLFARLQPLDLDAAGQRRWLLAHRSAVALHGLAWGALGVVTLGSAETAEFMLLTYALAAMAAGAMILTAFDLVAASSFALPTFLPIVWHLDRRPPADGPGIVLYVVMLSAITALAAMRARQAMLDNVRLRLAETGRAEQARRHAEAADRARAELAEQHHLQRLLMRTSQQGYWFVDLHGITLDANAAMCRMLGREPADVVGRPAQSFFSGEDLAVLQRELQRREAGEPGSYEITIRRPDGTRVHCHNAATPLYDTQGRRVGSVGIWTDVTVRREAEQALHMYELVANSIDDAVSVIGEDGVYRLVNDAWCRALGVPRPQALGRRFADILPPDQVELRHRALATCVREGRPHVLRGIGTTGAFVGRHFESTYYPYPDFTPGVRCVAVVTRDVTEQEHARQALADSAEYLARTLNATGDAIFASDATDPSQPVRFVNEQMLQMWGIPAAAAPTLSPARIMSYAMPLFADPMAEGRHVATVIAENRHDESRVRLRDGRVLLRRCIPSSAGGRRLRVWSFRDVTAEERALQLAQASDAEQRALLDAFPGYIFAVDGERRCTYVNDRLAALLGRPPAQLIGRSLCNETGDDSWMDCAPHFRRAIAGERAVAERHFPASAAHDALDLEFTYVAGAQRNGRRLYYAFGQDVTARKNAERNLIAARDAAESADRAKSQFLAQMSHELRTPMNAILGLGQLLASDPRQPLPPQQQRYLDEMLRGARHLLDLINEVLDLGRIEAGQLRIETADVDLGALADECLALVGPLALAREVRLPPAGALPAGLVVRADRMRLKQVLLNLLGNAIKYNRRGGSVMLECADQGDALRLGVRDTGPGIAPEQVQRLFRPFERLDAARGDVEGTGIGLALSRRLVDAMDGTIGVDSEPGVGSLFWLRLPRGQAVVAAPAAPVARAIEPAAQGARPLVLYIEDNPVNVFIMEALFERLPDVRLTCAMRPAEGLVLARQERPAVILLDMQLPEMDGLDVLARLRDGPQTRSIPVIAVSANGMAADVEAALAAGAVDYLTKPLDLEVLAAALRRWSAVAAGD